MPMGEQQQQQRGTGGSRPGSTTSTPYGSYDQGGGYWPGYSAPHYAVAVVPQQQQQQQQHGGEEVKHPISTLRSARRHPQAPHAHQPSSHYPTNPSADPSSRHSHSHDPSNPTHHVSLSRTQHRHSYAPYAYPSSADPSAANSPASSQGSDYSDDEGPSNLMRGSHVPGSGIGMVGSPPGSGQSHAIGQLQKALAYNFTPSGSPVLGPLKGLTLASAAASRAGSVVHSRASSPIHLPPLKLPPSMERAANGVGIPGSGTSGSGSGGTSGATSGNGSPENGGARHDGAGYHPHRIQHRAHPYGGKSVPGSPVYDAPARGTSGFSPPPMSLSRSIAAEADKHRIRDILHGSMGVGGQHPQGDRTLPPISSLGALFNSSSSNLPPPATGSTTNAYFPSSNPGSRHPSPPSVLESHFSSASASQGGSTDSMASLGGGRGLRAGFGMTTMGERRSPSAEVLMKNEEEEDQLMDL